MNISGVELLARIGAERVLNSIPQGLLIAAFAWLLLRIVAAKNSATRFVVWFSALFAVAAAPFLPHLTPTGQLTHALTRSLALPYGLLIAMFTGWFLMATVAMLRFAVGFWHLRTVRNSCHTVNTSDLPLPLQEVVAEFAAVRNAAICTSPAVRVPTTIGFFTPAVILPEWAFRDLTAEELQPILLHEFAHLQRRDDWTNLVQQLVRAIFFFHPAVMWIERRLSIEREMACDDVVLAQTQNPRAYAECLVNLAEKSLVGRGLAMAQAAISRAHETCLRVSRILDVNRPTEISGRKPALAITTALIVGCLIALPYVPRLTVVAEKASAPADSSVARAIAPHLPVIPAMARIESNSAPARTTLQLSVAAMNRSPHRAHLVAVKQKPVRRPPALVMNAAARQVTPAPQFLVLTRTIEFDSQGSAIVSVYMWRITFVPRNPSPTTVVARST